MGGGKQGEGRTAASHGGKVNTFFLQYMKCDVNNAPARVAAGMGKPCRAAGGGGRGARAVAEVVWCRAGTVHGEGGMV